MHILHPFCLFLKGYVIAYISLLNVIFEFFTPERLTFTKFQDERMTRTTVITENVNPK